MEGSSWENHLFLWAIFTMAMLVITKGQSSAHSCPLIHALKPGLSESVAWVSQFSHFAKCSINLCSSVFLTSELKDLIIITDPILCHHSFHVCSFRVQSCLLDSDFRRRSRSRSVAAADRWSELGTENLHHGREKSTRMYTKALKEGPKDWLT